MTARVKPRKARRTLENMACTLLVRDEFWVASGIAEGKPNFIP
jgi:hypothetical protein